ncbi:MAG: molybdopterin-dependent oxidoreductase [Alphaproteobacteria bacterium]|nr:molybdopterin-dependent oxidoreductase [Alphaproteobacteria bacterium]
MPSEYIHSVCPHDCPSVCALEVERLDEKTIGKVKGAADNDYTDGIICAKVSRYKERVHHPDRLLYPLKRVGPKGSGEFERISWEEALDTVANAFKTATEAYGPEAVWPYKYAGTMGLVQRDGIKRLTNTMGYSRQKETICTGLVTPGWNAGVGNAWGTDPRDMAKSDLIVIWGTNVVSTHIHAMTHALKGRKGRGAKIVVIDPYLNDTAKKADMHLAVRPGTDGALACAVMHVLFKEGYADREYLEKYTDDPVGFEQHLEDKTPAWAAKITGLTEDEINAFAHLYGKTQRSYIKVGYGLSRSRNGAVNVHAVVCLPAVTGAWKHKGGGAMRGNGGLYKINTRLIEASDKVNKDVRLLDMSRIGPVLVGDKKDIGDGPPVTAMLIQNMNPAAVAPEHDKVRQGLLREDLFVCVHEQFMTESAKLADIVLPATTFLEHDDIYMGGGHVYLQAARAMIEAPGECRPNDYVITELAKRLGAQHPSLELSAWEIIDGALKESGYIGADELYEQHWLDCSKSHEDQNHLNGFGFPDGKFRFAPDWKSLGDAQGKIPAMPDHWEVIDEVTSERPFRLVTAPARNFLNSSFTETPSSVKIEGKPKAKIHPKVCAELGLDENDRVRLGNNKGDVVVHVEPFEGLHRDTVIVEGIWPNHAFEEGKGINLLTSAEAGLPNGGAVFHDTSIWIRKV